VYVDERGKRWKIEFLLRDPEQELKDKKSKILIKERLRIRGGNNINMLGFISFLGLIYRKGGCIKHTTSKLLINTK
jgi:hypothetical protein